MTSQSLKTHLKTISVWGNFVSWYLGQATCCSGCCATGYGRISLDREESDHAWLNRMSKFGQKNCPRLAVHLGLDCQNLSLVPLIRVVAKPPNTSDSEGLYSRPASWWRFQHPSLSLKPGFLRSYFPLLFPVIIKGFPVLAQWESLLCLYLIATASWSLLQLSIYVLQLFQCS